MPLKALFLVNICLQILCDTGINSIIINEILFFLSPITASEAPRGWSHDIWPLPRWGQMGTHCWLS